MVRTVRGQVLGFDRSGTVPLHAEQGATRSDETPAARENGASTLVACWDPRAEREGAPRTCRRMCQVSADSFLKRGKAIAEDERSVRYEDVLDRQLGQSTQNGSQADRTLVGREP